MRKIKSKKRKQKIINHNLLVILRVSIPGLILLFVVFSIFLASKSTSFCANSISCIQNLSGDRDEDDKGIFQGKTVYAPILGDRNLQANNNPYVLAAQTGDYKHIYVDLTNQRLYAFEGNNIIMNVPVSTGKWNKTPTGDFRIWIWLRYTRMTGGSGAGYYNLPNVPFTMYFYNKAIPKSSGYSLHGTYWHDNFGHPMSHGCVNMRTSDAEKLYYWTNSAAGNVSYASEANPGTLITIYGITPKE